jgi:hypothetical protein
VFLDSEVIEAESKETDVSSVTILYPLMCDYLLSP